MGIVFDEVVFQGRAPPLSAIVDKITELSGLPLTVTESGAGVKGELYELHGYLAFACAPEQQIEIHVYRDGAVQKLCKEMFGDVHLPIAQYVQGNNEPVGTQSVHLRGYLGQEPTLLIMTTLALEALGGSSRHPLGEEERRQFGTPISPAQLEERRRKVARQGWLLAVACLLLLPVMIPLSIVGLVVMTPWRVWKGYRLYRSFTGDKNGSRPAS